MNDSETIIRVCGPGDVPAITRIYEHYVLHELATFEIEPPGAGEMERRMRNTLDRGFPYLVAEREEEVVGYAYAGLYRSRPAYRFTVENSVYIRKDCLRMGVGRLLLERLIEECGKRGFCRMIAVIGDSANFASIGLHESVGFELVGILRAVGFKFGRWVDSVLMQRELACGGRDKPAERIFR